MKLRMDLLIFSAALTLLVGCGGGGGDSSGGGASSYSGNTSAATVSESNRTSAAKTAAIGAEKAIEIEIGAESTPFSAARQAARSATSNIRSISQRTSGTYDDSDLCSSGSASYYYNIADDGNSGTLDYDFNNCTLSYSYTYDVTYDGTVFYEFEADNSYYYSYDLTVSYGGETYTLKSTIYCDSDYNCSYEENFTSGGVSYRVSDTEVSYSYGTYDLTARVYHEDLGYITIEAENLSVCSGGGFDSGTIEVTDSTGSVVMSVVFDSCTTMTVTYNGVATTVDQ